MNSHDGFDEAVAAYALGALDEAERGVFETHLATCADCQRELAGLDRVTTGLGLAAGAVVPPASLKARTLARATSQPQREHATTDPTSVLRRATDHRMGGLPSSPPAPGRSWTWLAVAAGIVVSLGLLAYVAALQSQIRSLQRTAADAATRAEELRAELVDVRLHSVRLTNMLDVVNAPDLVRIDLQGQSTTPGAVGRAFMSGTRGLLFSVENLPALPADRTYQVWAIPPGAAPVGVGLFDVDATGASSIPLTIPASLANLQTIAVTVEPAGGSPGPTSAIVLAGSRS